MTFPSFESVGSQIGDNNGHQAMSHPEIVQYDTAKKRAESQLNSAIARENDITNRQRVNSAQSLFTHPLVRQIAPSQQFLSRPQDNKQTYFIGTQSPIQNGPTYHQQIPKFTHQIPNYVQQQQQQSVRTAYRTIPNISPNNSQFATYDQKQPVQHSNTFVKSLQVIPKASLSPIRQSQNYQLVNNYQLASTYQLTHIPSRFSVPQSGRTSMVDHRSVKSNIIDQNSRQNSTDHHNSIQKERQNPSGFPGYMLTSHSQNNSITKMETHPQIRIISSPKTLLMPGTSNNRNHAAISANPTYVQAKPSSTFAAGLESYSSFQSDTNGYPLRGITKVVNHNNIKKLPRNYQINYLNKRTTPNIQQINIPTQIKFSPSNMYYVTKNVRQQPQ